MKELRLLDFGVTGVSVEQWEVLEWNETEWLTEVFLWKNHEDRTDARLI